MTELSIQAIMASCLGVPVILGRRSGRYPTAHSALRLRYLRKRSAAIRQLEAAIAAGADADGLLWDALTLFEGFPFHTAKGLVFTYKIRGGEMFVDRKDKSITQSSVQIAFRKALELGRSVKGPKKLGTFGASYLYPIFIRLGVIQKTR